jgi:hypothetical protein
MHVEVEVVVEARLEGVVPVVIVDAVAVGGAMRVVGIGVEAHHRVIVDDVKGVVSD